MRRTSISTYRRPMMTRGVAFIPIRPTMARRTVRDPGCGARCSAGAAPFPSDRRCDGVAARLDLSAQATFKLGAEDSGSEDAPVVYRAFSDDEVRLIGGRTVSGWRPAT